MAYTVRLYFWYFFWTASCRFAENESFNPVRLYQVMALARRFGIPHRPVLIKNLRPIWPSLPIFAPVLLLHTYQERLRDMARWSLDNLLLLPNNSNKVPIPSRLPAWQISQILAYNAKLFWFIGRVFLCLPPLLISSNRLFIINETLV